MVVGVSVQLYEPHVAPLAGFTDEVRRRWRKRQATLWAREHSRFDGHLVLEDVPAWGHPRLVRTPWGLYGLVIR